MCTFPKIGGTGESSSTAILVVGLGSGLFGYDNAFAAPLVSLPHFVQKYQGHGEAFTANNLSLIFSVPLVGSALGGLLAGLPLQRKIGRKYTCLVAYTLCCVPGSVLQLFAPNIGALVFGRTWNYFGVAILMCVCPIYLADLVPPHLRGRAVGVLTCYMAGVAVLGTVTVWGSQRVQSDWQYKIPLTLQACLPALFFLTSCFLVESPTWLVLRGDVENARRVLLSLRKNNHELVEAEISSLIQAITSNQSQRADLKWWYILRRQNLKRTLTTSMYICLSQIGGQVLTLQYSTVILVQSGVSDPFRITILIFMVQFLGMVVGPYLMDRLGRRPTCLVGFTILFFLDVAAGGLACAGLESPARSQAIAALFIIFSFINAASFQSICYLVYAEIPPAKLREPTAAYTSLWGMVTATATTFAVPQITNPDAGNLGAKAALIFAGCQLITITLTYFYLPETRGRTMAEIDEMYAAGIPMSAWKYPKKPRAKSRAVDTCITRRESATTGTKHFQPRPSGLSPISSPESSRAITTPSDPSWTPNDSAQIPISSPFSSPNQSNQLDDILSQQRTEEYLTHFDVALCEILSTFTSIHPSPIRIYILPLSYQHVGLLHATLSLAACHMGTSEIDNNQTMLTTAIEHEVQAIQSLGALLLKEEYFGLNDAEEELTLAMVLILVLHDICESGKSLHGTHLNGVVFLLFPNCCQTDWSYSIQRLLVGCAFMGFSGAEKSALTNDVRQYVFDADDFSLETIVGCPAGLFQRIGAALEAGKSYLVKKLSVNNFQDS
ncbi:uncharacterized protein Z518_05608 [Rhinocladiella mackenziei CBS 650.93]|uniref:Major facilitator superfamily (MFS) profile domain-containing protein n=1 Tax=Rhinocladiella mackenziei CBS 650.93 TaxID=1442369 RepID=A0A0D2H2S9_9EURO|nr:uncharacterized protein Z518_05608 [Rhinocladiella mackenziei CBS 650.93]KIX04738.1 hypothetical protein Z518_05608 [Rhinocladiella mackenziei CBS 650.93]